jgi:tetratricopeptide (TPR) repeat protein
LICLERHGFRDHTHDVHVGVYELLEAIGEGGAGSVYRARAPSGEVVAVKLLKHANPGATARFDRERRLLASLGENEGFVPLLDSGTQGDATFIAMPLIEGGTLRGRLERGPLDVNGTIELGRALARALGAAHARGIVHRDVKPENVLFTADGRPLLADLGLAKHFDREARGASLSISVSRHGSFLGTASYAAPEQVQDAKNVGPAADVFSLGAVLYECLEGSPPFTGDSLVEVVTKLATGRFRPLARSDAPRWALQAIERALAHEPRARPGDGYALARTLEAPASKRRAGLVALVFVAVAAVAALALQARRSPPKPAPATPSARDHLARGLAAYRQHEHLVATDAFTTALELDPRLAEAMAWRSLSLSALRAKDSAARDAKAALELAPRLPLAWVAKAVVSREAVDAKSAVAEATRAIELDPRFALAWAVRGLPRGATGNPDGALADEEKAIELDPTFALAWTYRGFCLMKKEALADAIASLTKAIELDPRLAEAWEHRSACREEQGDFQGEADDATRSIELDPGEPGPWFRRSNARINLEDFEGAVADATKAIALAPLARAYETRGIAREGVKDYAGVIEDMTHVLELEAKNRIAFLFRGGARHMTGDREGAIQDYESFVAVAPDDARVPEIERRLAILRESH